MLHVRQRQRTDRRETSPVTAKKEHDEIEMVR